jgi:hypothetical protein
MWMRSGPGALLLLAFALGTVLAWHLPARPLEASPADVRGSDNVLVTGYRNRAGTFLLWSSGRITRPDGSVANAAGRYHPAAGFSRPGRVAGQVVGSGNLACGVVPDAAGTLVVFSDGSALRPDDPGAGASCLQTRVVWGVVEPGPAYGQGSGDWAVRLNPNQTYHISFDPPFERTPAVVTGGTGGDYRLYNLNRSGLDLYDRNGHAPDPTKALTFVAAGG